MLKKVFEALLSKDSGFQNFVHRRFLKMELAISVLAAFSAPLSLEGAAIFVPGDQPTIQAAINAAADGDSVFVNPGTYSENINFLGKQISVTSVQGPQVTIIDGRQLDSVVSFVSGERGAVLGGFTLRNGRSGFDTPGFGSGGGIRVVGSSPTIVQNVISGNRACNGAGIASDSAAPTILENIITGNSQFGCSGGIGGGGISVLGRTTNSIAQIIDNVISENVMGSANGGGISLFSAGPAIVRGNIIKGNIATGLSPCAAGGGIWIVNFSDSLLVQNLITGNTAGCGGGVFWSVPQGGTGPILVNNTIADNGAQQGSGVLADGFDAQTLLINNIIVGKPGQTALFCDPLRDPNPPIIKFNDIFSPGGAAYGGACTDQTGLNGNISEDPLFVDPTNGDYHLQLGSGAIDAGDNTASGLPATDFDGKNRIRDGNGDGSAVVDMGPFESTFPFTAFLHGSGSNANPAVLFLDGAAPTSSTAKFRDSAGIKFQGGNAWTPIGTWAAGPTFTSGNLRALSDLHVWLGLKNSDDIGTRFDLAAEVWKNGTLVAEGETLCITGVTRNPAQAKEVAVSFQPFSAVSFDGSNDVLILNVFTRIGTDGSGGFCGGHSNAVGLRLYFDAVGRDARFGGEFD